MTADDYGAWPSYKPGTFIEFFENTNDKWMATGQPQYSVANNSLLIYSFTYTRSISLTEISVKM